MFKVLLDPSDFQKKSFSRNMQGFPGFVRLLHTSTTACVAEANKSGKEVQPASQGGRSSSVPPPNPARLPDGPPGVPTALDKKFLVWSGYFKSEDQIPKTLEGNIIHRARSWGRIRINIGFLIFAAALGGAMAYSGKRAAARGESMEQENLDWHRQIKDDYKGTSNK